MEAQDLADLLRHLRESTHLSVSVLAQRAGVAPSTVYGWEGRPDYCLRAIVAYLSALEACGVEITVKKGRRNPVLTLVRRLP